MRSTLKESGERKCPPSCVIQLVSWQAPAAMPVTVRGPIGEDWTARLNEAL